MSTGRRKTTSSADKLQRLHDEIVRVHSRMFRWANKLDKLIKARARLERLQDEERKPLVKPVDLPKPDPVKEPDHLQVLTGVDESLDIAAQPWIKSTSRGNLTDADKAAIAGIKAAQEERKKVKAKASSEKSRAKRRGELAKMPLTGKAALAAIRESK
jgi:hypothetical protein